MEAARYELHEILSRILLRRLARKIDVTRCFKLLHSFIGPVRHGLSRASRPGQKAEEGRGEEACARAIRSKERAFCYHVGIFSLCFLIMIISAAG